MSRSKSNTRSSFDIQRFQVGNSDAEFFAVASYFLRDHSALYSLVLHPIVARIREILNGTQPKGAGPVVLVVGKNGEGVSPRKEEGRQEERPSWSVNDEVYERWGMAGVELAVKNMDRVVDLLKERGVKLTIVVNLWPVNITSRENPRQPAIWKKFAEEKGINFIDYFPVFIDEPIAAGISDRDIISRYFLPNDVHWHEEGHKLVVDVLLKVMPRTK